MITSKISKAAVAQIILCLLLTLITTLILSTIRRGEIFPPMIVAGQLPISDSFSYFGEIWRFDGFREFSDFGSRRPLHTLYLNSIYRLTGFSLDQTIFFLAIIFAVCLGAFILEIWRQYSFSAALLAAIAGLGFYTCFQSATLMSEHLEFCAGLLSAVFFLKFLTNGRVSLSLLGLLFLSIGLNARAGALLAIPAVLCGLVLKFPRIRTVRGFAMAIVALILPFIFNYQLSRQFGPPQEVLFSNFSLSLYGLARGGGGWTRYYDEHSQLLTETGLPSPTAIYTEIAQLILNNPIDLMSGIGQAFRTAITDGKLAVFVLGLPLQVLYSCLFIVGIFFLLGAKSDPRRQFFLWMLVGNILSLPFLVDALPRAFAATVPLLLCIVAIGLDPLGKWVDRRYGSSISSDKKKMDFLTAIGTVAILALLIPRQLLTDRYPSSDFTKSCTKAAMGISWMDPDSIIQVVPNATRAKSTEIELSPYLNSLKLIGAHKLEFNGLSRVNLNQHVTVAFDLCSKKMKYLILDSSVSLKGFYSWQPEAEIPGAGGLVVRIKSISEFNAHHS